MEEAIKSNRWRRCCLKNLMTEDQEYKQKKLKIGIKNHIMVYSTIIDLRGQPI